ncbi:MAG TPA: hypothetical protein VGL19_18635 [Polyangiaceae bacterium]
MAPPAPAISSTPSSISTAVAGKTVGPLAASGSAAVCSSAAAQSPRKPQLKLPPAAANAWAATPGLWLADEHYAQLSSAPDPGWAEGAASYVGGGAALRGVAMSRLPKSLRAWLGRTVRVLGASGTVCETRLQRFAIRAEVTPDPATAEVWEGCADPPVPPSAIAEEIWRSSANSGRTLVAEFSAACQGALLAIDPELPTPPIAAPEPAAADLGERALAAFRELPAYAELQARYKAELPTAEGAWEDHDARRGIWSLRLPAHTPLVFVSVEVGARCAKFSGSLSALWAASAEGAPFSLSLLVVPRALDQRRLTPSAVVDLDASGNPAVLLGPDGQFAARTLLRKPSGAGYGQTLLKSVPYLLGPC